MFPIVQDQWLNILTLNNLTFSYYGILYYLSGLLFPIITVYYSLKMNLYYKSVNENLSNNKKVKFIFYPITLTLFSLSLLLNKYFFYTFNLLNNKTINSNLLNIKLEIIFLFIIFILLMFDKTKRILRKLLIVNFFILSLIIWTNFYFNLLDKSIFINEYFMNISFLEEKNINIYNVTYLLILELLFYIWSYFGYKNNIGNWSIPYPNKSDIKPMIKMIIFYSGILIYYLIFNRLN